jgi:hypothetical protein
MAERIRQLPREVVASFRLTDAEQRVQKLREVENEISFGMRPVISWLERRRSADTAELVKRRLFVVLSEAVQCAGMDIPQYAGGVIARVDEAAPGALRTGSVAVAARMFAASLVDWANDIEAEDRKQWAGQGGGNGESNSVTPSVLPKLMSAADLAKAASLNQAALDTALRRYAAKYPDCRIEQESPRPNEPRYLYRVADVWSVVQKLLANRWVTGG